MQTDGRTNMTKLIVAFRNFAEAQKKERERERQRERNICYALNVTHQLQHFQYDNILV